MINTDGISCPIMLIRNDMIGRRIPTVPNIAIITSGVEVISNISSYLLYQQYQDYE